MAPFNFYDFNPESKQPLLHLAHANGFPPATYSRSLKPILEKFHVVSFYARPFWPDRLQAQTIKDWSVLTDDLLEGLKQLQAKKIVAIGHSLGGVTTLNAAIREPELFSHIVLIDPTMLPPFFLKKISFFKYFGVELRKDLVRGTLRRRRYWDNRDQAYDSFKRKPLFKQWPDEILQAYVDGITVPDERGGIRLIYSVEGEARIYQTIPTDVWKKAKLIQQPTLVIRGENSNIFTSESEKTFRKMNPKVLFEVIKESGHLVPQEQPDKVSRIIADFLKDV